LYLQLQYIHPSNRPEDERFANLIKSVSAKTKKPGFDARIIIGNNEAHDWIKNMRDNWGFDDSKIRVQYRVHNKGIIVDDTAVVVSSTNWSENSVTRAREAGVLVRSKAIAAYYREVFDLDWKEGIKPADIDKATTVLDGADAL